MAALWAEVRAAAGPRARFLGVKAHDAMPAIYKSADLLCLPSWWEAMPLSVLEAMATGLPVVASTVGDVPRVVQDGVTGLLVTPHDPTGLAEALAQLLSNAPRRASMGRAGRRRVEERFRASATIAALDALYAEL